MLFVNRWLLECALTKCPVAGRNICIWTSWRKPGRQSSWADSRTTRKQQWKPQESMGGGCVIVVRHHMELPKLEGAGESTNRIIKLQSTECISYRPTSTRSNTACITLPRAPYIVYATGALEGDLLQPTLQNYTPTDIRSPSNIQPSPQFTTADIATHNWSQLLLVN
ncbi:hypothetical protein J6590_004579 [Homalodisca vitripennis]|nr:hypothetical protein J6590_004579 [Homalodisca vitripennis]